MTNHATFGDSFSHILKKVVGQIGQKKDTIPAANIFGKKQHDNPFERISPQQVLERTQGNQTVVGYNGNVSGGLGNQLRSGMNPPQIQPKISTMPIQMVNQNQVPSFTANKNIANQANRPNNLPSSTQAVDPRINPRANQPNQVNIQNKNIQPPNPSNNDKNLMSHMNQPPKGKPIDNNHVTLAGNTFNSLKERMGALLNKNVQRVETIDNTYKAFTNLQRIGENTSFQQPQQPQTPVLNSPVISANNQQVPRYTSPILQQQAPPQPIKHQCPPPSSTQSSQYIFYMKDITPNINNLDILLSYTFQYLINHINPLNIPHNLQQFINELLHYSHNLNNHLNQERYKYLKQLNYSQEHQDKIIRSYNQFYELKTLLEGFQYAIEYKLTRSHQQYNHLLSFAADVYFYITNMYQRRRDQLIHIFKHDFEQPQINQLQDNIQQQQQSLLNHHHNNPFPQNITYHHPTYPIEITGESLAREMGSGMSVNQLFNTHSRQILDSQLLQLEILKNELSRLYLRKQVECQEHLWLEHRSFYDAGRIDDFVCGGGYRNKKPKYNESSETCIIIQIAPTPSPSTPKKQKESSLSHLPHSSNTSRTSRTSRTSKIVKIYEVIHFKIVISLEHCKEETTVKVIEGCLQIKVDPKSANFIEKGQKYIEKYVQTHFSKYLLSGYHVRSQCSGKLKNQNEHTIKITFINTLKIKNNYTLNFDHILIEDNGLFLKNLTITNQYGQARWKHPICINNIDLQQDFIIQDNSISCYHSAFNQPCQITFYNFPKYITRNRHIMASPDRVYEKLTGKVERSKKKVIKIDYGGQIYVLGFQCFFQGEDMVFLEGQERKKEEDRGVQRQGGLVELENMVLEDDIINVRFQTSPQASQIEQLEISKMQSAESILQDQEQDQQPLPPIKTQSESKPQHKS